MNPTSPVVIVGVAGVVGLFGEWARNAKSDKNTLDPSQTHASGKFFIATVAVAMGISVIADLSPIIGRDMAFLYLTGVILVEGVPLFSGISKILGS
jgi:uncharacterized membrane protein YgdD (TMEM256/DUF423 family)